MKFTNNLTTAALLLTALGQPLASHANPVPIVGNIWQQQGTNMTATEWNRNFTVTDQGQGDGDGKLDKIDDYIAAAVNTGSQKTGTLHILANAQIAHGLNDKVKSFLSFTGNFDFKAIIQPYANHQVDPANTPPSGYTSLMVQLESTFASDAWNFRINGIAPVASGRFKGVKEPTSGNSPTMRGWALFQIPGRAANYQLTVKAEGDRIYERLHSLRVDTAYTDGEAPLVATLKDDPQTWSPSAFPDRIETFERYTGRPQGFEGDWIWAMENQLAGYQSKALSNRDIGDNESSQWQLKAEIPADGKLLFDYALSTESGYDHFNFYIDGELMQSDSGYKPKMASTAFPIKKGAHTLKWEYKKDESVSDAKDTVWIDNLRFQAEVKSSDPQPAGQGQTVQ